MLLVCLSALKRHSIQSTINYYSRKWNFLIPVVWNSNGLLVISKQKAVCVLQMQILINNNKILICESKGQAVLGCVY